ncbi:MAG: hypothetical protein IKC19_07100, partial [Bacteroidales bacterium]|nr:hypothetical protein [Bacteroidales bacterium]
MKRILLFVFIFCLMVVGCNKTKQCEEYAPAGTSVSWTEYNSINRFMEYFYCHPATLKENGGKKIKICGYSTMTYRELLEEGVQWMYLTDDINGKGLKISLHLTTLGSDEQERKEILRDALADGNRKVYVSGAISRDFTPENGGDIGCCDILPNLYVDTITSTE